MLIRLRTRDFSICLLFLALWTAQQSIGFGAAQAPVAPATQELTTPDQPQATPSQPPAPLKRNSTGAAEIHLNFRGAPLQTVLNYLSEAAGFIIDLQTEVRGTMNLFSSQPVTAEEAFDLLNSALDRNGYTAIRNGRTLTIYTKEEAKRRNLPVKVGSRPEEIPKNDEMVTQIIPVRFIGAVQVSRDLQPLLPEKATMTANEGGNAIVMTDTQVNIRRMVEIIKALDTALASVSSVRVFPLRFADAKALATVIKDLFAPQDSARGGGNQGQGRLVNTTRGGGRGGGIAGGGSQRGGAGDAAGGRAPTPRVMAIAEEHSNSVVVNAPEEQMPIIEELVREVDTNVEDITELRVFHLKYADAQETADLLLNLFSDSNSTSGNNRGFRGQIQFGGAFGRGGGRGAAASQSARMLQQTKVSAVADARTGSVVVSASKDLMGQIAHMIDDLDSDPSKKQQVFVFDVQNTDAQAVQDILQSLFPAPLTGNLSNSRLNSRQQNSAGNQLNSRATMNQNQGMRGGMNNSRQGGGGASFGGFGQ